jgi:L-ascorbate metabolism protein UlaG (beta-lactamase superfamily)
MHAGSTMTPRTRSSTRPVRITWLGHSAFRCDTPGGKTIYIDPWLDNPKAPAGAASAATADLIFLTHGHADHLGNTVDLARRTGAQVYAIHELALYLQSRGVPNAVGMNISGTVTIGEISATMTDARHSGGIEVGEGTPGGTGILGGAAPAGFVITLENGYRIYHAGDTGLFGDMKLIGELYRPSLVILPIGGFYTMGPREAARACVLLKPKLILGMHYGTFPALAGNPAALKRALPPALRGRVRTLEPGESLAVK